MPEKNTCVLFGDPNIVTFDGALTHYWGNGSAPLVASADPKANFPNAQDEFMITAQFKATTYNLENNEGHTSTYETWIIDQGTIISVPPTEMNGVIEVNGTPVLWWAGQGTYAIPGGLGTISYLQTDPSKKIDTTRVDLPLGQVFIKLSMYDTAIQVDRYEDSIDISIMMLPMPKPPGQVGFCGNFDGDPNNDVTSMLSSLNPLQVHQQRKGVASATSRQLKALAMNDCAPCPPCTETTTTTTATTTSTRTKFKLPKNCTVWGDPHIISFDGQSLEYKSNGTVSLVESGDDEVDDLISIWADMRTTDWDAVHNSGWTSTYKLYITGTFIQDNFLIVPSSENNQQLTWNDVPELTYAGSTWAMPNGLGTMDYKPPIRSKQIDQDRADRPVGQIFMTFTKFPIAIQVDRYEQNIDVRINMVPGPKPPGQTGLCGNFNGDKNDDTVAARLTLEPYQLETQLYYDGELEAPPQPMMRSAYRSVGGHPQPKVVSRPPLVRPPWTIKGNEPWNAPGANR